MFNGSTHIFGTSGVRWLWQGPILVLGVAGTLLACSPGPLCQEGRHEVGLVCLDVADAATNRLGFAPSTLEVADVDGDGHSDLVVASGTSGSVSVLWGASGAPVALATTWSIGPDVTGLAVADLDGDGMIDVATTLPSAGAVCVLRGRGGRSLGPPERYPTGVRPQALLAADLDGSGPLELIVTHESGVVNVLVQMSPAAELDLGVRARDLAAADLDGDGDLDLALALTEQGAVQVLVGDGHGGLSVGPVYSVGAAPYAVVAADLDGDGAADLATADALDDTISVLLADTEGGFLPRAVWPTEPDPRDLIATRDGANQSVLHVLAHRTGSVQRIDPIAGPGLLGAASVLSNALGAGDLDGDLHDEVLVASALSGEVGAMTAGAGLQSVPRWEHLKDGPAYPIDLDDDGVDELVLSPVGEMSGDPKGAVHRLQILRSDGELLTEIATPFAPHQRIEGIRRADFTGDGRADLLVWGGLGASLLVQQNDGSFRAGALYPLTAPVYDVAIGDSDGDGSLNALVVIQGEIHASRLLALAFAADGAPRLLLDRSIDAPVLALVSADYDGDAIVDLVLLSARRPVLLLDAGQQEAPPTFTQLGLDGVRFIRLEETMSASTVDAWMCTDTGVVRVRNFLGREPAIPERIGTLPCDRLARIDLDQDGVLDVLTQHAIFTQGISSTRLTPWLQSGDAWVRLGSHSVATDLFGHVQIARLDSGAIPALIISSPNTPVQVRTLSLGPALQDTPLFAGAADFRATDLDSDGTIDIVGTGRAIGIAIGDGEGGFGAFHQRPLDDVLPGAEVIHGVAIGDFNAGGLQEIVVASRRVDSWQSDLTVLGINPDGTMHGAPLGTVAAGTMALFPADMDRDGRLDLFGVARGAPLDTVFLRGSGRGDFAMPSSTEVSGGGVFFNYRLMDLDRDGRLDLVGFTKSGIEFHAGQGDASFATRRTWAPITFLQSPTVGDFDRDGHLDLMGIRSERVVVVQGRGAASFGDPQVLLTDVSAVSAADLDGDGQLEVVATGANPEDPAQTTLHIGHFGVEGGLIFTRQKLLTPPPTEIKIFDFDGDDVLDLELRSAGHILLVGQSR